LGTPPSFTARLVFFEITMMLANTPPNAINTVQLQQLDKRAVGHRMMIRPSLVMTHEEIDTMITLIRTVLDKTLADVKKLGLM
jgi:adenosylmethionine-8-amino-7-oxononanoate aminotransferase